MFFWLQKESVSGFILLLRGWAMGPVSLGIQQCSDFVIVIIEEQLTAVDC